MTARTVLLLIALAAASPLMACDDDPSGGNAAGGPITPGPDFRPEVMAACGESLTRVDCGCFWTQSRIVFTQESLVPILQALKERDQWGGQITRIRLEKIVGEEGARTINRALYYCTRM